MGLSNEERTRKLVYATKRLTELGRGLPEDEEVLKSLTERLWPALLRNKRNGAYWILGGDVDKDHVSGNSLFGNALLHHKPEQDEAPETDEPYASWARERLGVLALLQERQSDTAKVYEIYTWTEAACYALRRYEDELSKSLKDYDDTICQIQGECFTRMLEDDVLLRAWLTAKILEKVLTYEEDIVNTWWEKECMHHHTRLFEPYESIPTKRLLEIFKTVQFQTPGLNARIAITIELAGPRWHYAHSHRKALALFREHNGKLKRKLQNTSELINLKAVAAGVKKCAELHAARETLSRENYKQGIYCSLSQQSAGDFLEKPAPAAPAKQKRSKPRSKGKTERTTRPVLHSLKVGGTGRKHRTRKPTGARAGKVRRTKK